MCSTRRAKVDKQVFGYLKSQFPLVKQNKQYHRSISQEEMFVCEKCSLFCNVTHKSAPKVCKNRTVEELGEDGDCISSVSNQTSWYFLSVMMEQSQD